MLNKTYACCGNALFANADYSRMSFLANLSRTIHPASCRKYPPQYCCSFWFDEMYDMWHWPSIPKIHKIQPCLARQCPVYDSSRRNNLGQFDWLLGILSCWVNWCSNSNGLVQLLRPFLSFRIYLVISNSEQSMRKMHWSLELTKIICKMRYLAMVCFHYILYILTIQYIY